MELDWEPGDRLPDEILEQVQGQLERLIATPDDLADAVLYAVSAPLRLNIAEIVVRPAKSMQL
jgi:NADP-dependent 3-hydroxy acid dehydrogenase YdfG